MRRLVMSKSSAVAAVLDAIFSERLAMRNDLHIARKLWHVGMGLTMILVYLLTGMSQQTAILILGSVLGVDLLVETARLRLPAFNQQVCKYWGPFMRSCEVNKMSGAPYYILSSLLALTIFPKPVGVLSILFLAIGDPFASVMGITFGKKSIRIAQGKSLIGTLSGIAACTLVSLVFLKVYPIPVTDGAWWMISLVGGVAGGTAELAPFDLDDNFTIPMISGFVLWLAFMAFGL